MSLLQSQPLTGSSTTLEVTSPRPHPQPLSERGVHTLSVVIPSYNNLAALWRCLRSLYDTAFEHGRVGRLEVIVQDDSSPDFNIADVVGPPAFVARNERNQGFAGNCNAGAMRARADILLFLNQDTKARPGWFEPLLAIFADPKVGSVGPKLVFGTNPHGNPDDSIQSCGGLYDGGKGPFHRYLGFAADDWRVNEREPVSWTTGAALAIRRELFMQVGGFDVGYERGYFEDVDLCEKVKAAGFEIWYCPEATFEHSVGSTGGVPGHIFKANSMRFHEKWNDRIKPDTNIVHVNY